jgi:hypothetical protein
MGDLTTPTPTISIRSATPADGRTLARLAALDSAPVPFGPTLVAEIDGAPRAALSVRDGSVIADPFARTAEVVSLLRMHAAALAERESARIAPVAGLGRRLGLAA